MAADTFHCISQCLIASRRLRFAYRSPATDRITQRTVEPHHLQYYNASWVLTARCLLRNQWRKFYLARMDRLSPTNETFTPCQWQIGAVGW